MYVYVCYSCVYFMYTEKKHLFIERPVEKKIRLHCNLSILILHDQNGHYLTIIKKTRKRMDIMTVSTPHGMQVCISRLYAHNKESL